jgi:hypothetical protein
MLVSIPKFHADEADSEAERRSADEIVQRCHYAECAHIQEQGGFGRWMRHWNSLHVRARPEPCKQTDTPLGSLPKPEPNT